MSSLICEATLTSDDMTGGCSSLSELTARLTSSLEATGEAARFAIIVV
jgi:hypothetical protein